MNMGERIRAIRKGQGLTLDEVARRAGLYKSNISDIENEKRFKPNLKTLEKLAAALGCEVGDFFGPRVVSESATTQGLQELMQDERSMTLLKITNEELEWLKSIRFRPSRRPTKEIYVDLLYSFRRLESQDGWDEATDDHGGGPAPGSPPAA